MVANHMSYVDMALGLYGFVATLQVDANFGHILAYGGRVRGRVTGLGNGGRRISTRPYDVIGAAVCLLGVAVIMYAPRGA